jgi:hypothetical protein
MDSGLETNSVEQHQRFIDQVAANKTVWGLKSSDGWAMTLSNEIEERQVMPFWSDRLSAKKVAAEKWATSEPVSIKLNEFIDLWLRSMHEDGTLVGTNWDAYLMGKEIEPDALRKEILDTLE